MLYTVSEIIIDYILQLYSHVEGLVLEFQCIN